MSVRVGLPQRRLALRTNLFIGGEWVAAEAGATALSFNPATGEQIAEVASASVADTRRAVDAAREAFDEGPWPRMSGRCCA